MSSKRSKRSSPQFHHGPYDTSSELSTPNDLEPASPHTPRRSARLSQSSVETATPSSIDFSRDPVLKPKKIGAGRRKRSFPSIDESNGTGDSSVEHPSSADELASTDGDEFYRLRSRRPRRSLGNLEVVDDGSTSRELNRDVSPKSSYVLAKSRQSVQDVNISPAVSDDLLPIDVESIGTNSAELRSSATFTVRSKRSANKVSSRGSYPGTILAKDLSKKSGGESAASSERIDSLPSSSRQPTDAPSTSKSLATSNRRQSGRSNLSANPEETLARTDQDSESDVQEPSTIHPVKDDAMTQSMVNNRRLYPTSTPYQRVARTSLSGFQLSEITGGSSAGSLDTTGRQRTVEVSTSKSTFVSGRNQSGRYPGTIVVRDLSKKTTILEKSGDESQEEHSTSQRSSDDKITPSETGSNEGPPASSTTSKSSGSVTSSNTDVPDRWWEDPPPPVGYIDVSKVSLYDDHHVDGDLAGSGDDGNLDDTADDDDDDDTIQVEDTEDETEVEGRVKRAKQTSPAQRKMAKSGRSEKNRFCSDSWLRNTFKFYLGPDVRINMRQTLPALQNAVTQHMENVIEAAGAYAEHAGRDELTVADMLLVMRRQRLYNDETSLRAVLEKFCSRETVTAVMGNVHLDLDGNVVFDSKGL